MSNYIHPITTAAAEEVARNLRPDDYREVVEGHGYDPLEHLLLVASDPKSVYFTVPNGEVAGLAGVALDGQIWMLCTPAIHKYPVTFARESKRFVLHISCDRTQTERYSHDYTFKMCNDLHHQSAHYHLILIYIIVFPV